MTLAEVLRHLDKGIEEAGSRKALAARLGVSPGYLGDVLLGARAPARKLLDALGMRKVVSYEYKETQHKGA